IDYSSCSTYTTLLIFFSTIEYCSFYTLKHTFTPFGLTVLLVLVWYSSALLFALAIQSLPSVRAYYTTIYDYSSFSRLSSLVALATLLPLLPLRLTTAHYLTSRTQSALFLPN
ncbi:hypothetical protein V494_07907, partial [Pseudogymnoascus sp. VKM F-4513 (FW-928)]